MSIANDYIQLSENAASSIKEILRDNELEGAGLRFGIRGGGCSGYSYVLEFSEAPEEGDATLEIEGVSVFLGEFKRDFLKGTLIDYESDEFEAGFKIKNPNAKRACGCGESFDIDDKGNGASPAS